MNSIGDLVGKQLEDLVRPVAAAPQALRDDPWTQTRIQQAGAQPPPSFAVTHTIDHGDGRRTTLKGDIGLDHPMLAGSPLAPPKSLSQPANYAGEMGAPAPLPSESSGQRSAVSGQPPAPLSNPQSAIPNSQYSLPKTAPLPESFLRNTVAATPNSLQGRTAAPPLALLDQTRAATAQQQAQQARSAALSAAYAKGSRGEDLDETATAEEIKLHQQGLAKFNATRKTEISQQNADTRAGQAKAQAEMGGQKFESLKAWREYQMGKGDREFDLKLDRELRQQKVSEAHIAQIQQKIKAGETMGNLITTDDGHVYRLDANGRTQLLSKPVVTGRTTETEILDSNGKVIGKKKIDATIHRAAPAQVLQGSQPAAPAEPEATVTMELNGKRRAIPAGRVEEMRKLGAKEV